MSLFWAVPCRDPRTKTRPPGARPRAPSPGLAPGWGTGNPFLGRVNLSSIGVFESLFVCLTRTSLLWETLTAT